MTLNACVIGDNDILGKAFASPNPVTELEHTWKTLVLQRKYKSLRENYFRWFARPTEEYSCPNGLPDRKQAAPCGPQAFQGRAQKTHI